MPRKYLSPARTIYHHCITAKPKTYPGQATPWYCPDTCHTYSIARVCHLSWQYPCVWPDQDMSLVLQCITNTEGCNHQHGTFYRKKADIRSFYVAGQGKLSPLGQPKPSVCVKMKRKCRNEWQEQRGHPLCLTWRSHLSSGHSHHQPKSMKACGLVVAAWAKPCSSTFLLHDFIKKKKRKKRNYLKKDDDRVLLAGWLSSQISDRFCCVPGLCPTIHWRTFLKSTLQAFPTWPSCE